MTKTGEELAKEYKELSERLEEIEAVTGAYLYDPNIDAENADEYEEGSAEWWRTLLTSAKMNAGQRADDAGLDINDYFDRPIY